MRINLKDFLDYASHKHPGAVAAAVIHNVKTAQKIRAKKGGHGLRGFGDASTDSIDAPFTSYLYDVSTTSTDLNVPDQTSVVFAPTGQAAPSNIVAVNSTTGQNTSNPLVDIAKNLINSVPGLLTAYTANKQLSTCAQTNQARVSQGLPPIDCSSFAPQANVGLAPSTQKMFTYALLGGGALVLFALMRR